MNIALNFSLPSSFKVFGLTVLTTLAVSNFAIAQTPERPKVEDDSRFPTTTTEDDSRFPGTTTEGGTTTPTTEGGATESSPFPSTPPTTTTGGGGGTTQPKIEDARKNQETPPDPDHPLDGVVERSTIMDKKILPYEPVRETDIMWSKRVWRVIDVREKMNHSFSYPEESFIEILMKGVKDSTIRAYSVEDDKFYHKLSSEEVAKMGSSVDSIETIDPVTYERKIKIVVNKMNPEDIKRFRVKEDWFFDRESSILKVRILGIAPLKEVKDDAGNFLYEQPLFWVYYPNCREYLAKQRVFMDGNDANPMSWEDLFEIRRFSSYIYKESNPQDRRLQDYLTGVDLLLEGEKIKDGIFNFEHDLWSY